MELELQFGKFCPENRTVFLDVPLLPEIFRGNDPKNHLPSNRIFRKLFVNGKQPMYRTWTIAILPRLRDNSQW